MKFEARDFQHDTEVYRMSYFFKRRVKNMAEMRIFKVTCVKVNSYLMRSKNK